MDLKLDPSTAGQYTSGSQIARVVTEAWANVNLYCLACSSNHLTATSPNTRVRDFSCPSCNTSYQLKSKNGKHGRVVGNSAYDPKIAAIDEGRAPHYAFLDYSSDSWTVTGLFVVPGHFITRGVIQQRNPLKQSARRAGWVGSNILLNQIMPEGRISLLYDGAFRDPSVVRAEWKRVAFLGSDARAKGGWGADVLSCVRQMELDTGDREFTLRAFYSRFTEQLSLLHPDNNNVQAKIRQQLQVLRDGGMLEFLGRGRYRTIT